MSIPVVLLAAGYSRRLERFKPEVLIGEMPLLLHAVHNALAAGLPAIVVTGYRAETVEAMISGLPAVTTSHNERYAEGMLSSVLAGIAAIPPPRGPFFVQPGDMPFIDPDVYRLLSSASGEVRVPVFREKRGHPVYFSAACAQEVLDLPINSTLREYIHTKTVSEIPVACPGILFDIDSPEDVNAACLLARGEPDDRNATYRK